MYDLPNGQKIRGEDAWAAFEKNVLNNPKFKNASPATIDFMLLFGDSAEHLGNIVIERIAPHPAAGPMAAALVLAALAHRTEMLKQNPPDLSELAAKIAAAEGWTL